MSSSKVTLTSSERINLLSRWNFFDRPTLSQAVPSNTSRHSGSSSGEYAAARFFSDDHVRTIMMTVFAGVVIVRAECFSQTPNSAC